MISYRKAVETLGQRVMELREADPVKDFWKALDTAIAEVGGVSYGKNETRSKLGYTLSGMIVQTMKTPGEMDVWFDND